eukprot:2675591-Heterocapsa_arctica.AAC.1
MAQCVPISHLPDCRCAFNVAQHPIYGVYEDDAESLRSHRSGHQSAWHQVLRLPADVDRWPPCKAHPSR